MSKQNTPKEKQVSLAGVANTKKKDPKKEKKSRFRPWMVWAPLLLVTVVIVVVLLVKPEKEAGPTLAPREFVEYTYTADDKLADVSYYALGISGDELDDRLDALAIMCFDRREHKITVMQVPTLTYVDKGDTFATSVAGDVWGQPKARPWCDTCRGYVAADALADGKHTACGTTAVTRPGSSATDLARLFNTQFGLPVDNYLVISREGLAQLVDALGGVTVILEKELNVGGIKYPAGETTLAGEAAVYYATQHGYTGKAASEVARMKQQRQVFAGLLSRLAEKEVSQLFSETETDILSGLMNGTSPIRFDTTSFGKARLLGKSNDSATDNVRYNQVLAEFLHAVSRVELQKVVCCILPGENTKQGSQTVYSAYKAETLALLNEQMNPYGLTLDDTTVGL
ncbi:MAG: hypothetical protein E7541_07565, partial [Ruminococcaceae bacterium]|nr:hypothetical protein [Oscillospiraceae bacterium]